MSAVGRWLRALGRFWWQFLVGDTPEVAVGVLGIVGLSFALEHVPSGRRHRDPVAVRVAPGIEQLAGTAATCPFRPTPSELPRRR